MKNLIYLNGSLVREDEAKISVFDRGFLYGDGLFETMRAYAGKIFRLKNHLRRLFHSAAMISLTIPKGKKEMSEIICRTLAVNNLKEAYIRLTVSRGRGGTGPDVTDNLRPTVIVTVKPLPHYFHRWYEEGMKAILVEMKRDEISPLSRIKSLNYLPTVLARLEIKNKGADEGIMLNTRGHLAEGTVSNIFLVSEGKVITPSVKSGILPGITRAAILELIPQLGIEISEREIEVRELREAGESFLTNSLREVVPLTQVDGHLIGEGKPGRITRMITEAYSRLVEKETEDQVTS